MEIQTQILTEEEIKRLIDEILKNPEKYPIEAKMLLKLNVSFRKGGCGWVYRYSNDYQVLYGDVDEVEILNSEYNCDVMREIVIIPKSVPVVILQKHHDDNPEVNDYITLHVFTGFEWRVLEFIVPK
jgi:hypothetical protein